MSDGAQKRPLIELPQNGMAAVISAVARRRAIALAVALARSLSRQSSGRFGGSTTAHLAVSMSSAAPWRTLSLTWGKDSD